MIQVWYNILSQRIFYPLEDSQILVVIFGTFAVLKILTYLFNLAFSLFGGSKKWYKMLSNLSISQRKLGAIWYVFRKYELKIN